VTLVQSIVRILLIVKVSRLIKANHIYIDADVTSQSEAQCEEFIEGNVKKFGF